MNVTEEYFKILKNSRLFLGLSAEEIKVLASSMTYSEFETNQTLVYEGDSGNELFIMLKGFVVVSMKCDTNDLVLEKLECGEFFGEMAMLEQESRSATCRALEAVACAVLTTEDFENIILQQPKIANVVLNNMLKIMSERLMKTNKLVLQIIQWGDEARKRAITDEFTGLYNRRYLEESFEGLIKRSQSTHGLVFAMVDIDYFSKLNSIYGIVFCDKIILEITNIFKSSFKTEDILIRYGGDEFCFILYDSLENAKQECEKVCAKIYALKFNLDSNIKISCSTGLATYSPNMSKQELLKRADIALYSAKENGRNRVMLYK